MNPAHLFLGTPRDNAVDMVTKGRGVDNAGSRHGLARLTETQVAAIRRIYAEGGISQAKLARRFGINQSTVSRIVAGRRWRHTV